MIGPVGKGWFLLVGIGAIVEPGAPCGDGGTIRGEAGPCAYEILVYATRQPNKYSSRRNGLSTGK